VTTGEESRAEQREREESTAMEKTGEASRGTKGVQRR